MRETFVFGLEFLKRFVGAKVMCIDGEFQPYPNLPFNPKDINLPQRFKVYTIREVVAVCGGGVGFLLVEITNKKFRFRNQDTGDESMSEPVFDPARFEFL